IGRNQVERGHKLQNGMILPLTTIGTLSPVGPFRFRRQPGAAPTLHNTGHHEDRTPTHGYALAIFQDPTLQTVFMARHASPEGMSAQKNEFRISKIRSIIASFDTRLAEVFQTFYERSVDFGGHPNPHSIMSAIQMPESPVDQSFTALALSTDKQVLLHAMKSAAQVGLTALFIFQHIFTPKFELLGIREEMDKLRSEHL